MAIPKYSSNVGVATTSIDAANLTSAFGAGSEFALYLGQNQVPHVTWQTAFSTAPSTVTVLLQASLDGLNWFTIDTSTNTAGEIRTISGSFPFVRINNSVVTGGAGKTLTASFVYGRSLVPSEFFPPLLNTVIVIPSASILTLFTTPFELIPAVSGKVIMPEQGYMVRQPGTAYTRVGVTSFQGHWAGSLAVGINWLSLGVAQLDAFIGQTALASMIYNRPVSANNGTGFGLMVGTAAQLSITGANFAGGTGDIHFFLRYRVWPVADL